MASFWKPENSDSMVSNITRRAPTALHGVLEPDEQAVEVVFAGLLDLAALDVDVVDDQLPLRDEVVQIDAE